MEEITQKHLLRRVAVLLCEAGASNTALFSWLCSIPHLSFSRSDNIRYVALNSLCVCQQNSIHIAVHYTVNFKLQQTKGFACVWVQIERGCVQSTRLIWLQHADERTSCRRSQTQKRFQRHQAATDPGPGTSNPEQRSLSPFPICCS